MLFRSPLLLIYIYVLDMPCIRGRARGHTVGCAGGRGLDDPASINSVPNRGRGWRGRSQGIVVEGSASSEYVEASGGLLPGRLWLRS